MKPQIMKLTFNLKKFLMISTTLTFAIATITATGVYISLKPKAESLSAFYNDDNLNAEFLLNSRIKSLLQNQTNLATSTQSLATNVNSNTSLQTKPQTLDPVIEVRKPDDSDFANTSSGLNIFQYRTSAIAIRKTAPTTVVNKNLFSSDLMFKRLLKASGFNDNPNFDDVIRYFGDFLDEVAPMIPQYFSLTPISLVDINPQGYISLETGVESRATFVEYAGNPIVYTDSLFIDSFQMFMLNYYDPLNYSENISEDTKMANILQYILIGKFNHLLGGGSAANIVSENGRRIMLKIFAETDEEGDVFQEITTPKNIESNSDTDEPLYKALGNTIADVKKSYKKFRQKLAISILENTKYSMLTAIYRTITKHMLLSLNREDEKNFQDYGFWTRSGGYLGVYKPFYDKFKEIFKDTKLAEAAFDGIAKGNTSYPNYEGQAFKEGLYSGYDTKKDEFKKHPKGFYAPVYGSRTIDWTNNHDLQFRLDVHGFAFAPTSINFEKGIVDQSTLDTKNTITTNGFNTNRLNLVNSSETVSGKRDLLFNFWQEKEFKKDSYKSYLKSDHNEKGYSIRGNGMNLFNTTFNPFFATMVQQQLDYFEKNSNNYGSSFAFPPEVLPLAPEYMRTNYVQFFFQTRGLYAHLYKRELDSNGEFKKFSVTSDILSPNNNPLVSRFLNYDVENNPEKELFVGRYEPHSAVSWTVGESFIKLGNELYKNINDFALKNNTFNPGEQNKTNKFHWKSLKQFFEAAALYFINLGGARSYSINDLFFSNSLDGRASIGTTQINSQTRGPALSTIDGLSIDERIGTALAINNNAYLNINHFQHFIPTMAGTLNYRIANANYKDLEDPTKKISMDDILLYNTNYFKVLSGFKHVGIELFNEVEKTTISTPTETTLIPIDSTTSTSTTNTFIQTDSTEVGNIQNNIKNGGLSEISKKFIKVFMEEVLGYKYYFRTLHWDVKESNRWDMYGFYNNNNNLNNIYNNFSKTNLPVTNFPSYIKWASKIGGIDNSNYQEESLENYKSWLRNNMIVGVYANADIGSRSNSTVNNDLIFEFKDLVNDENFTVFNEGNANNFSNNLSPINFFKNKKINNDNVVTVAVKRNGFIPGF